MNEPTPDPEVQNALDQLAPPPPHGPGFWDQLDSGVTAQAGSNEGQSPNRRAPYLALVAAAIAVLVGGSLFLSLRGDGTQDIDVAVATTTTTRPTATSAPATTIAATSTTLATAEGERPSSAVDRSTRFATRARSDLFHYDVGVPDQFSIDYETGRGVSISLVGENFDAGLQVSNYLPDSPDLGDFTDPYTGEVVESRRTLTVPLYENTTGNITDEGVILEITEVTFSGGFSENRIVRVYLFDDRTVVAELRYNDGVLDDDPQVILDDIRMFNAAFVPIQSCSTLDAEVPLAPPGLNPEQASTFDAITAALADCDWNALDELTPSTFMASFGGGDPVELWRSAEAFDDPILAILLDHLSVTPAIGVDGLASWPRAANKFWEDVTDEMKSELMKLGYSETDFEFYEEIGYIGYRTGIDATGTWIYFVAGD